MSHWDAKRDVIVLDTSCLADGCEKPIVHTADTQPDLWCQDHLNHFREKAKWLSGAREYYKKMKPKETMKDLR